MAQYVFFLVLSPILLVLIATGTKCMVKGIRLSLKSRRCTMHVNARCIDIEEQCVSSRNCVGRVSRHKLFKPVYEAVIEEKRVIYEQPHYSLFFHYEKGENVEMMVNPQNHGEWYIDSGKFDKDGYILMGMFHYGLAALVVCKTFLLLS